jgi:hypothetical protein
MEPRRRWPTMALMSQSLAAGTITAPVRPGRSRRHGERRWVRWITWAAILTPLPYSLSRLLWAAGIPLGIDEELLREFHSPGWGSLYILILALLPEATALFTHAFVASRMRTVPDRIPIVGGRPVRRWLVIDALLAPILILAGFNAWSLGPITAGFSIPETNAGLPGWSFWGQIATFWIWGVSLAVATAAYWHATRSWDSDASSGHDPAVAA